MKRTLTVCVLIATLALPMSAQSLKGMALNGATGLISVPSGRIGWEHSADIGIDFGYHAVLEDDTFHIPKASISLFQLAEFAAAYDVQEDSDNSDILFNGKIQLPTAGTAVALGGNVQVVTSGGEDLSYRQLYLAATYPGRVFDMPAETTVVVGKTFGDNVPDNDIDFGMGFDVLLFPDVFQGYIHWVNDFANFSYSFDPRGADAGQRGVFNTGVRIDLAASPSLSKFKFVVDAIVTDALDANRAFTLGAVFGITFR